MSTLRLPGLVDVHVHLRQPGADHKETWATGTAAALAGGITTVLAMPNTSPATVDEPSLDRTGDLAASAARCDYGLFVGANEENADDAAKLADRTAGLKMYLGETYGDLRLRKRSAWAAHLEAWPADRVVAVHAAGETLAAVIDIAAAVGRGIHVCHVASAGDIVQIADARQRGLAITCEVAPHHLFLDSSSPLPPGRAQVRPPLGTPQDRETLWRHLDVVDCFATDHAPHTAAEKDGEDPPPGFPGLETMLPLLLTAVDAGRLTIDDVVTRLHHRPTEIYRLPPTDAEVEVEVEERWTVRADAMHTRCDWTPFEGRRLLGRVQRVTLRGETVFEDGEVVAAPGAGRDVRAEGSAP